MHVFLNKCRRIFILAMLWLIPMRIREKMGGNAGEIIKNKEKSCLDQ
jgi:hypothetical protein